MSRRGLAAGLLVVAAVLFGIGTAVEAAEGSEPRETETSETTEEQEESESILGIDATSPAVIGFGIALSLGAAAALVLVRRRPLDLGIAAFAGLFGVLDLAEAVSGLREDEIAIGILALVIATMHLAVAWLAANLEASEGSALEPA